MINQIKKHLTRIVVICLVCFALIGSVEAESKATNEEKVEMADTFRKEGKIYVLTGVILIIFLGFFGYAYSIERKVKKIEKSLESKV